MKKIALLAAASLGIIVSQANAAQVGVGAFSSPTVVGFGNPGAPGNYASVGEPLNIGPVTFTTANASGFRWWGAGTSFLDCVGGCVTTEDSVNTIFANLATPYNMVGFYVGQATAYNLDVSFYDTLNNLLGTVNVTGPSDGVSFAGWQSGGAIGKVGITNSSNNSFVISAQSAFLQNGVPEPATWAMMITGFGLVGGAMRRKAKVQVSMA